MKYPRDYRGLPQNLMSAMTASVPLTAVQITDANLLKMEKTHTYTLLNWLKNPNINIILLYHNSYKLLVLQFFQILHKTFSQNAVASSCRRSLCPALSLSWYKTLQSSPAFKGDPCCESSTAAVTLLCRADARLLNLSDSLTNPLQSLKSQPSNAP